MTSDDFRPNDFRRRADAVRSIPLELVLTRWGGERDQRDKSQWNTQRGPLSVTGSKFFNWHRNEGGGGAIDLVMHLSGQDVAVAVQWLEQHLGSGPATMPLASQDAQRSSSSVGAGIAPYKQLRLPAADRHHLGRVVRYLTRDRGLDANMLWPLFDARKIYADPRGNAVFLMVAGKAQRVVGAELRGTGRRVWRGLAPGTRKDDGYFWIGAAGTEKTQSSPIVVLCESAIDAISCFQLHSRGCLQLPSTGPAQTCICISTAGVRSAPPWLDPLLDRGCQIYCGFDDDKTGNDASHQMIKRHPSIERLLPPAHDWNDALRNN